MHATWFSRLVRGFLLIIWIVGLLVVALAPLEGTLSKVILSSRESVPLLVASKLGRISEALPSNEKNCPNGSSVLSDFLEFVSHAPPIANILDDLLPG
jgi:hypothetical protein